MSEQDEQRPLTRRERRLREMAETGALDISEVSGATEPPADPDPASVPSAGEGEIEISPFNEDGTPRSRREMRQLREEALAARAAQEAPAETGEAQAEPSQAEEAGTDRAAEREAPADTATGEAPTERETEAGTEGETQPEVETEVEVQPEVETEVGVRPEVETQAEAEVEAEADVEAEAVVESEAVSEPEAEVGTEPAAASVEPESEGEPETEPEPEREPEAEPEAAAEPENEAEPEPEAIPEPPVEETSEEPAAPAAGAAPLDDEPDFDSLIAPPTEPFTVAELREAEQPSSDAEEGADAVGEEPVAPEAAEAPSKPKRRFWQRNKDDVVSDAAESENVEAPDAGTEASGAKDAAIDGAADAVADESAAFPGDEEPTDADIVGAEPVVTAVIPEISDTEGAPAESAAESEAPEAPEAAEDVARPGESPDQKTSYSFPDIAPPEEWRSVFDDPSARVVPDQGGKTGDGDFDDLISRAVAQEGSTGGTGGAALILPSMPEDTGGLTGPLGGTGELYVTGSLKLPKSLGETGGHAALHDSIELDPITGVEAAETETTGQGPAPVSARHAVSARAASGMPVVAKPTKERSKLPLILSLTGGGLLIAVIALGAWGASNGLFG